jgi:hypothetical protein
MNKSEVVKECFMPDGIGAQLWRKIYVMSYAKYYNLLFENTPITDFLIHESDKVYSEEEKNKFLEKFNTILKNPWQDVDFSNKDNFFLSEKVGLGYSNIYGDAGLIKMPWPFLEVAKEFSTIEKTENNVIIHIRRGNVIPENPRWVEESVYIDMLQILPDFLKKIEVVPDRVIILTDAPDTNKKYKPINQHQLNKWQQGHLYKDENDSFEITSINFELLKNAYPGVEILNNLDTYTAFNMMVMAKVLITGRSAFSQSAGLLSKNTVVSIDNYSSVFKNIQ